MCYSIRINNFSPNNKQQSKHACTVHPKKADHGTTAVLGSFAPDLRECTVVVSEPVMGTIEIGNTSVSCIAFACVFGTWVVSHAMATGQGIQQDECEQRDGGAFLTLSWAFPSCSVPLSQLLLMLIYSRISLSGCKNVVGIAVVTTS